MENKIKFIGQTCGILTVVIIVIICISVICCAKVVATEQMGFFANK